MLVRRVASGALAAMVVLAGGGFSAAVDEPAGGTGQGRYVTGRLEPIPLGEAWSVNDHDVVAGQTRELRAAIHDLRTGRTTSLPPVTPTAWPSVAEIITTSGKVAITYALPGSVNSGVAVHDLTTGATSVVPLQPGIDDLELWDMTDAGIVLGRASDRDVGGSGTDFTFDTRTGVWRNITAEIDAPSSWVTGINGTGWVTGTTGEQCFAYQLATGETIPVPLLAGETSCGPTDITDAGLMAGRMEHVGAPGTSPGIVFTYDLRTGGSARPVPEAGDASVSAFNDRGLLTGRRAAGDYAYDPRTHTVTPIGVLPGYTWSETTAVNRHGTIVSVSTSVAKGNAAAVYRLPDTAGHQCFVAAAYDDFLDRAATPDEVRDITALLDTGATTRPAVLRTLATSDEWINAIITALYQQTLGRSPDPAGMAFWTRRVQAGARVELVAAAFYSSQEHFVRAGGQTTTWVEDLYVKLLDRAPDPGGVTHWVRLTEQVGRGRIALAFYRSIESRRRRVTALYQQLLDRAPDTVGLAYWADRVQRDGDISLAVHLAASDEYFDHAQT